MKNNATRLIIFSASSHINKIISLDITDSDIIVSFSLDGKIALEKKGLKCLFPDDLIELPDLNRIGLDNLERVKNICNFMDIKLRDIMVPRTEMVVLDINSTIEELHQKFIETGYSRILFYSEKIV